MRQSTAKGLESRLNSRERLQAASSSSSAPTKSKRAKVDSSKVFEFVLVRFDDENDDDVNSDTILTDENTVLRGFISLNTEANELAVRKALSDAIQMKYPVVASQDLTQPVNCHEYSFKHAKSLAGQGAIYVRLKHGFSFLLENQGSDSSSLHDYEFSNHTQSRPISTLQPTEGPLANDKRTEGRPISTAQPTEGPQADDNHTESRPISTPQPTEGPQADDSVDLHTVTADSNLSAVATVNLVTLETAVAQCISICENNNVGNPVEILKCAQKYILQGCPLDVNSPEQPLDGETNFVCIAQFNVLNSAVEEFKDIKNPKLYTLEVSFYVEKAYDAGGPRKEFFRLCLKEIQQRYFENGLRELMAKEYEFIGTIMAMSILQNGPIPRFIHEEILQEIFSDDSSRPCIAELRKGFRKLGLYQSAKSLPLFIHLMRPNEASRLSRRQLILLLKPSFSEDGTNARKYENDVYAVFSKYVRETAGGRRGTVTLGSILQFVTGLDEEPPLGFGIQYVDAPKELKWSFISKANTCSVTMLLPRGSHDLPLPAEEDLFEVYDAAFSNNYFGLA